MAAKKYVISSKATDGQGKPVKLYIVDVSGEKSFKYNPKKVYHAGKDVNKAVEFTKEEAESYVEALPEYTQKVLEIEELA